MIRGANSAQHGESWDLIPWLVNGRLSDAERAAVEAHLPDCEQCRREVDAQRHLREAIAEDNRIDCVPSASLQRLWVRIDAGESEEGALRPEPNSRRSPVQRRPDPWVGTRWLVAAVVVEAIGLGIFGAAWLSSSASQPTPTAEYRTVTSPAGAPPAGAVVRAVFAGGLTLAEMQNLLRDAGLRIVSGPTEAGVYSLAPAQPMDATHVAGALARLRAAHGVRFAEPIGDLALDAAGAPR